MNLKRCVITVAVGNLYYHKLSKNLLESFLLSNKSNAISFLLITDNITFFSDYGNIDKVYLKNILLSTNELSFVAKFKIYNSAFADENLFIDCDCLIYKDLTAVFDRTHKHSFTVIGKNVSSGSFFCDVSKMIGKFNIAYMPKFVGSVYFFKKNDIANSIFEKAIALKNNYDELGFVRLRGKENEEPLFSIAMALNNESPIEDDGSIKADIMFFEYVNCNILRGQAKLYNKLLVKNSDYYTPLSSNPCIVHYNDRYTQLAIYLSEQLRLNNRFLNPYLVEILVYFKYILPEAITNSLKAKLRPYYHKLFGPLAIKKIERLD